jgi:hypothetical protein
MYVWANWTYKNIIGSRKSLKRHVLFDLENLKILEIFKFYKANEFFWMSY